MHRRRFLAVIFLLIACLAVPAGSSADNLQELQPLRVGAILPLSGDFAFVGKEMQRGMQLALEDFSDYRIEIIYEDDRTFDAKSAVLAAKRLTGIEKVDILFNAVVNTTPAIASIVKSTATPTFVIWDSNKRLKALQGPIYGMGFSTEGAGEDMADFAYYEKGLRRISVISAHDEWSEIISNSFAERFAAAGGVVVQHSRVQITETDLRALILKAMQNKAEAIYAPLFSQSLTALIKQARAFRFPGILLTADGFFAAGN